MRVTITSVKSDVNAHVGMCSMPQLRVPSKPVWWLIGVHTLCLCVGYWFMCQLLVSSTEHQALEDAWVDLIDRSEPLALVAGNSVGTDLTSESPAHDRLQSLAESLAGSDQTGVILVSSDWSLLKPISAAALNDWRAGDSVRWQFDQRPVSAHGGMRGRIKTNRGNLAAIGYPVADARAYVVAYDLRSLAPAWRLSLLESLPLAGGIAFLWTWILSSVATYLLSARFNFEQANWKTQSEHDALRSAQDLLRTRDAVIFGLAKLAESRDPETGHHLERISQYSTRLANALRTLPKYHRIVTPGFVRLLGISSVLHDIGKVGLEDTVLLKPGRLTPEERTKMQEHTLVAGACLKEIEQRLGASNFLQTAREIALYHHERWDGTGYPTGLSGETIPLAARIVTVADVYDALSSKRVYKDAFPHAECVRLIREGAGSQFDPELVAVFLSIESDFAAIARRFAAANQSATEAAQSVLPVDTAMMTPAQESVLRDVVPDPVSSKESTELPSAVV